MGKTVLSHACDPEHQTLSSVVDFKLSAGVKIALFYQRHAILLGWGAVMDALSVQGTLLEEKACHSINIVEQFEFLFNVGLLYYKQTPTIIQLDNATAMGPP